jgi:hypothetical protein
VGSGTSVRAELTNLLGGRDQQTYDRIAERFICRGLNLTSPVDNLPDAKYPFLKNLRAYRDFLQPRPGVVDVAGAFGVATGNRVTNTIRRLNDEIVGDFTRLVQAAGRVLFGKTTMAIADAGFSGEPVAFVPLRPINSPRPWMYVGDSTLMRKIRQDGLSHFIGLDTPPRQPRAELEEPKYKDIDTFEYVNDAALQANWTAGPIAGTPTTLVRVSTTIATILTDDFRTSGWALVEPASIVNIQEGMRIVVDSGGGNEENITLQSISFATTPTTIANILYDNTLQQASFCSIVFETPIEGIRRDSLLFLSGTEHVRVLSASIGPDGTSSVRVQTTITHVPGGSVVAKASFRAFFTNPHGADALDGTAMRSVFAFTDISKVGTLTRSGFALDLSDIETGLVTQSNDVFHISLRFSSLNLLGEGRILIDIDDGTFKRNYFVFPFRPDDLTPAIAGATTFVTQRDDVITRGISNQPTIDDLLRQYNESFNEAFDADLIFGNLQGFNPDTFEAGEEFRAGILAEIARLQRQSVGPGVVDPTAPGQSQINTGDDSWQELIFRVRDAIRVGTDFTKTLKDANAFRVELSSEEETSLTVDVDSWWLGGGKNPFLGNFGFPYIYRYRSRVSITGTVSNNSTPLRSGVTPVRQEVNVRLPGITSISTFTAEQVDKLDVSRFGGGLLEWHFLGSVDNFRERIITDATNAIPIVLTIQGLAPSHSIPDGTFVHVEGVGGNLDANGFFITANATPTTLELVGSVGSGLYTVGGAVNPAFKDNFKDEDIVANPTVRNDNFRLWPIVGQPISGTTVSVSGTTLEADTLAFDRRLAPGTVIHIDGVPFAIYRVIDEPPGNLDPFYNSVELVRNAGNQGAVGWNIFEPVVQGVPLPALWGPFEGFTFACGDPNNPGVLYFTKQNSPDSTTETHKIEITSPSEPLMNGVMYNGRSYVWSTERMFALYPAFNEESLFKWVEVPNGKGMFSRWFLAVGPKIWFGAKDGIYETVGGEPVSITDADLYPLFPHEGQPGEDVNEILTPDFSQDSKLRLAYYDKYLYFDYRVTPDGPDGVSRTLVYDTRWAGWFYDEYIVEGEVRGVSTHYGDEGLGVHGIFMGADTPGTENRLLQLTGQADFGLSGPTPIPVDIECQVRTASRNEGDARSRKRYGDVYVEADTDNISLEAEVALDEHSRIVGVKTFDLDIRDDSIIDINDGKGELGRNLSLDLSWSSQNLIKLFLWERSVLPRPVDVTLRAGDYYDAREPGDKFFQGLLLEADTKGVDRRIRVQFDNDQDGPLLTVNHDGRIRKPVSFETPFHAHQVRLLPIDAADWRLFSFDWIWEPSPELVRFYQTQPTSHGLTGFQHLRSAQIAIEATSEVLMTITFDGEERTVTVNSTKGELKKRYVILPVMKAKIFSYRLESDEGFRLYVKDCEVKVKQWDSADEYQTAHPFGGESFRVGALI